MTKAEELAAALRGEGCLGQSQPDEPVFILVARDRIAATVVRVWAKLARLLGSRDAKTSGAMDVADQMDAWRAAHDGGKVPD